MPELTPATVSQRVRAAWLSPQAFATSLVSLFVDAYGTEGLNWAEETIRQEINDDFSIELPRANFDRLMAAIAIITTDDFYNSLPDFIQLCNILSGDTYDPRVWDPADSEEVAWGITEAIMIYPPDSQEPFSDEIRAYIGKVLDAEGIMQPPDILKLALRDEAVEQLTSRVQADFTDDPVMFEAIYAAEQSKSDDIDQIIKGNLVKLVKQLRDLPLRHGDPSQAVSNMLRSLGQS